MAPQWGFVGMGPIGQAISERLVKSGLLEGNLLLFNRTYEVAQQHAHSIQHAVAMLSLSELVQQCDIIWSCLADDRAIDETSTTILEGPVTGKLFVECSTVSVDTIDGLNDRVLQAGAHLVAIPVFGEPSTAKAGQLIVVPAGPAAAIDQIRPFLIGTIASAIIDFPNESPSKANLLKLIGNVLIMKTLEQVAELLVFAEKAELGVQNAERLLSALYPGGPRQYITYASLMNSGQYHQRKAIVGTEMALGVASKIVSLAKSLQVELKGYNVAVEHLKVAHDTAGPSSDILSIYGAVREESGLNFEN